MNEKLKGSKRPCESRVAHRSSASPGLGIPRRAARQQSPTPFYQTEIVYRNDGTIEQVYPARFSDKDWFAIRLFRRQAGMQLNTILRFSDGL